MLYQVTEFLGYGVEATDGDIGRVDDLFFDDREWITRYVVVDTGPLFLGRRVVLSPESFISLDPEEEVLKVNLTREQVERSPDVDLHRPVSEQEITALHDYYAWPIFWGAPGAGAPVSGTGLAGGMPYGALAVTSGEATHEEAEEERIAEARGEGFRWDMNLRSADEVIGYFIEAKDGSIGRLDDLLFDDENLSIRYLVLTIGGLLSANKVVIPREWVYRLDADKSAVHLDVTQDRVRTAPEFNDTLPLRDDYGRDLAA